jgi:hypothetical protein
MAERFQTVARNIIRLYSLCDAERTEALRVGLEEIVACVGPRRAEDWNVVGADAERLLKVWLAREGTDAAHVVGEQLVDLLYELADRDDSGTATPMGAKTAPPVSPVLIISEDKIVHVPSLVGGAMTAVVPTQILTDSEDEGTDDGASTESEAAGQLDAEKVEEEEAASETSAEAEVEVEADASSEQEEEEEAAEDEEGEAEESEEEEGEAELEVEQVVIRGRSYWLDVNTKKLYASVGEDDDVGDQVGEMVDGKPRFFAKA